MRLFFMGSPEFAVPSLRALVEAGHEIVAVFTQPDRPSGRGRKLQPPPVKAAALEYGLDVHQPPSISAPDVVDEIRRMEPEAGVIAAYGQLLKQRLLDVPPLGILNVHASLLPRWRGASPVSAAILAGDRESGATIMRVRLELDAGPMLEQVRVRIAPRGYDGHADGEDRGGGRGAAGRRAAALRVGRTGAGRAGRVAGDLRAAHQEGGRAARLRARRRGDGGAQGARVQPVAGCVRVLRRRAAADPRVHAGAAQLPSQAGDHLLVRGGSASRRSSTQGSASCAARARSRWSACRRRAGGRCSRGRGSMGTGMRWGSGCWRGSGARHRFDAKMED